jgi:hypothetical protein
MLIHRKLWSIKGSYDKFYDESFAKSGITTILHACRCTSELLRNSAYFSPDVGNNDAFHVFYRGYPILKQVRCNERGGPCLLIDFKNRTTTICGGQQFTVVENNKTTPDVILFVQCYSLVVSN